MIFIRNRLDFREHWYFPPKKLQITKKGHWCAEYRHLTKYDNPLHSSFTNNFPNLFVVLQRDKWRYQRMHHLIDRPSENSYRKRFVIFQVVLPLQFFFYYPNYANFGNTGSRDTAAKCTAHALYFYFLSMLPYWKLLARITNSGSDREFWKT